MTAPTTAPTLTDGVVTLRAHRAEDVPRVVEQCRDPVSVAWTTVPTPYAESDAEEFGLRLVPGWWAEGKEWGFAVEIEGRYAGTVSLRDEGPGRAEIAYAAHPDVRGTGAMLRALRLLVDWGFAELDIETIVSRKINTLAAGPVSRAPLPSSASCRQAATKRSARAGSLQGGESQ